MSSRLVAGVLVVAALGLGGLVLGCSQSPTSPALRETVVQSGPVTVTGITPARGLAGDQLTIEGTGFIFGVSVTLNGVTARVSALTTGTVIKAIAPALPAGTVDVVVTNPSGKSATLPAAYTFETVSLIGSPTLVAPGGQLTVSWVAPGGRSKVDWIGLFKKGVPTTSYEDGWWKYTGGASSGILTLTAPTQGEYEFRYLLDDDFNEAARSGPITVR